MAGVDKREVYRDGQLIETVDVPVPDEVVNQRSLLEKGEAAIDAMGKIANAESFTNAQRDAAIKTIAKAVRVLLRLALNRLDAGE
jgi:hypothetical protein